MFASAVLVWTVSVSAADSPVAISENVRISRDDTPYGEPYIAQHPKLSDHLVAIASKFTTSGPTLAVVFTSRDGGHSWREVVLPTGDVSHAVDCWVAFADTGTVYASVLVIERGDKRTKIAIFRSDDDGESWARISTIAAERSFDRPSLVARGTELLVATEYRGGIALLHSRDRGRTFTAPRPFRPSENLDHNAMNPIWVGPSVLLPYVDYGGNLQSSRIGMVGTGNFGRTWSRPAVVADVPRRFPGLADVAAANGRIFVAFASGEPDSRTVSVVRFTEGEASVAPTVVSNPGRQAFRPAIAVSPTGLVGVTWIESDSGCTRLWFSSSTDHARTFAPPVPVSEEYSCGTTPENRIAFDRWEHGGDYFGLTARRDSFVAVWADARTGTFQIYTATITPPSTSPSDR